MRRLHVILALLISAGCSPAAESSPGPVVTAGVPFERFVLPNGLTLIVHEDHDEPVAHARIFYHVGEKDAGFGEAGYPHFFEHLAFSRTEHLNQSVWSFLEGIGARDYDATTRYDHTQYFATVPPHALDTLFWLEAERMAHLAGALTEEDLVRSRAEVSREEERLLQLPPIRLLEATWNHTYPEGHPYAGFDMDSEDLDHVTLTDARRFYARHYHPANATMVVAGDVDAEAVRQSVERYFGSIPPGSPRVESDRLIGRWSGTWRQRIDAVLPDAHLRLVWNTPGWGTPAADYLTLVSPIIVARIRARSTPTALASTVEIATDMRELGGQVMLDVTTSSPIHFPAIERIIHEEIARLGDDGPSAVELDEARARYRNRLEQDLARLSGVASLLGEAELFQGHPAHLDLRRRNAEAATPGDVRHAVNAWLTDGAFVLEFVPAAQH